MRLYLVRHGETDWNRARRVQGLTDIPLNDYGRHLARETADGMQDIGLDLAITSPLIRAKETAQILLGGRDIPLYEDSRLQEMSFGDYEGMCTGGDHPDPRSRIFNRFFTDTEHFEVLEGGESITDLYRRTGDFLQDISGRESLRDKRILISSHGASLTALLNRIRHNLTVAEFWKGQVPPNCSVTIVDVQEGDARIVSENLIFYREKVRQWKAV